MVKLKFIHTQNIFVLPDSEAEELLELYPSDYIVLNPQKNNKRIVRKNTKNNSKTANSKNLSKINSSILPLITDN